MPSDSRHESAERMWLLARAARFAAANGMPISAASYAERAAHIAFVYRPELRDEYCTKSGPR